MEGAERRQIAFHFHPYRFDESEHAIEKSEGGSRRRYLRGVASGPRMDAHNARMTKEAIDYFMEQANSGDILLYADVHGIRYTDDIGILTFADVTKSGDWFTEYRLYDNLDGVDDQSVQTADKLWKQINGVKPYRHPKQKGFSVEGYVPDGDDGIAYDQQGRQMIRRVELDGVVVVPRPAYQDSIAHAVYKALGEDPPWTDERSIQSRIQRKINEREAGDSYFRQRMQIDEATETLVSEAMRLPEPERRERLEEIFDEYKSLVVNLVLSNEEAFATDEISLDTSADEVGVSKDRMVQGLIASLQELERFVEKGA